MTISYFKYKSDTGKYIITAIKQVPGLDMGYGVTVLK